MQRPVRIAAPFLVLRIRDAADSVPRSTTMVLLDPTKKPTVDGQQLAARSHTTLDGLRIGLVGNSKLNADEILLAIGDLLAERYQIAGIVHDEKPSFSVPAPNDIVDKIAREADVVIAGVGD
jgi:hypothetical protein